jgi:hypothetical protein
MTNGPLRRPVLFRYRIGRKSLWLRAAQRHSEMTLGYLRRFGFRETRTPGK